MANEPKPKNKKKSGKKPTVVNWLRRSLSTRLCRPFCDVGPIPGDTFPFRTASADRSSFPICPGPARGPQIPRGGARKRLTRRDGTSSANIA